MSNAEQLWSDLRGHFANAQEIISEIIATKAWEPLGYSTFAEAWTDRMAGVPLATEVVRAHVVYALFDDGLSEEEAVQALGIGSRVGISAAKRLKEQHELGVPAALASTRVRSHFRNKPSPPKTIHVELSPDEYAEFKAIAIAREMDVAELASVAVREYFSKVMA
ncbi:hypothetical protein [Rhodococcus qingshengii]|uniref:hypothetical protein n=1 Tax=Rhodococcus qingshengii TaxID=334542 RepID=UPI002AFEDFC5|nr:hypothetical protein [Rhodococcus qingshengii]MEA1796714.1 hypothetical protein [Rhodococcus qingshengii]